MGKKIFIAIFLILCLLAMAMLGLGYWWYHQNIQPVTLGSGQTLSLGVKENQTTQSVLVELESKGLIRSQFASRIYLRLHTIPAILPGNYMISSNQSLPEIITTLSTKPKDIRITFPEGWRREQFALRLQQTYSQIPTSRFSYDQFLSQTQDIEGHLFPDTYLLPSDATTEQIIRILSSNKKSQIQDQQIIIIASLIERESRTDAERPIIAGIIKNRLDQGWFLNIDATIQYARDSNGTVDKYWQPVTDTKFPSPYNTYTNLGLPPGPICNPGLSAINAAQNPTKTDYMFYLHDSQGQVHYAKTLAEHNLNVDKYLKP